MLLCQRQWPPRRILFVDAGLIVPEAVAWCHRSGIEADVFSGHARGERLAVGHWYTLDLQGLFDQIARFEPDLVIQVNGKVDPVGILGSLMALIGLPWAIWYVDNPMVGGRCREFFAQRSPFTFPLVFDAMALARLTTLHPTSEAIEGGWRKMPAIPLASEPRLFTAAAQPAERRDLPFVFVGASLYQAKQIAESTILVKKLPWSESLRQALEADYDTWCCRVWSGQPVETPDAILRHRLASAWPGVELDTPVDEDGGLELGGEGLLGLVEHYLTHRLRLRLAICFLDRGLTVYGDEGWQAGLEAEALARGLDLNQIIYPRVDYYSELPAIYGRSRVVLNSTRPSLWGIYNQRVLDGALAGAMVLSDPRPVLNQHFGTLASRMTSVGSVEMLRQVDRWEAQPQVLLQIRNELRNKVQTAHTYDVRMLEVFCAIETAGIPERPLLFDTPRLNARLGHPELGPPTAKALEQIKAIAPEC